MTLVTTESGEVVRVVAPCVHSACGGGTGHIGGWFSVIECDMRVHAARREHLPDWCVCGHMKEAHSAKRYACIACSRTEERCPKFVACMSREEAREARTEQRREARRRAREQRKHDLALAESIARRGALR